MLNGAIITSTLRDTSFPDDGLEFLKAILGCFWDGVGNVQTPNPVAGINASEVFLYDVSGFCLKFTRH